MITKAAVRDHIPLEQGLRLVTDAAVRAAPASQRPYSIRTRIKTIGISAVDNALTRQRPYSIRTRIKTRDLEESSQSALLCQRPYSIRTRIKTQCVQL